MSISVSDFAGGIWLSGFNDVGVAVLGKTANEMDELMQSDETAHGETIAKAIGKTFNFACRAKADSYNDQTRVKYHVMRAAEVNWKEATHSLLEEIAQYD